MIRPTDFPRSRKGGLRAFVGAGAATACLLLAALAALSVGCRRSYSRSGFLAKYQDLQFTESGGDLAFAIDLPQADDQRCDGIYLPEVVFRPDVLPRNKKLRDEIADLMQKRAYSWLKRSYEHAGLQVSSTPVNTVNLALAGKKAYQLEIVVTEVRKGFGLARWLIGFGLGASTMQVEGTLRSLPENELIARFACRNVNWGNSWCGLNPKSFSLRYCLRVSCDWIAQDISELPGIVFPVLRPTAEDLLKAQQENEKKK